MLKYPTSIVIAKSHRMAKEGQLLKSKKTKLKSKGKKYYQNTHGTVYRVKPNPKLSKQMALKKLKRRIAAQLAPKTE